MDIGTVDQTFDLDMSALQRTDTSRSSSSDGSSGNTAGSNSGSGGFGGMSASGGGAQGGLDMFGQIFNMGGSSSGSNGDDSTLTVAEVVVSVGQQVSEGDPLYLLEEDSVSGLEDELQSNVEKLRQIWRRWKPIRPCQNNRQNTLMTAALLTAVILIPSTVLHCRSFRIR